LLSAIVSPLKVTRTCRGVDSTCTRCCPPARFSSPKAWRDAATTMAILPWLPGFEPTIGDLLDRELWFPSRPIRFGYGAIVDERRAVNDNPPTVRLFRRHEEARDAIRALTKTGVRPRAISVIARSTLEVRALHRETGAAEDLEEKVRRD